MQQHGGEETGPLPERAGSPRAMLRWLARHWVLLLAGGVAGFLASTLTLGPTRYTAEALVATTPQRTVAQLDSTITTNSADTTAQNTLVLTPERRQALADLVAAPAIETPALEILKQTLPDQHFQPGDLVRRVHGALKPRSDVIAIDIDGETQAEATAIANAWAASYVDFVNALYVKSAGPPLDVLIQQRDQAGAQRDAAQQALVANLQASQLESLQDAIHQRQQEVDLLNASPVNFNSPSTDYRSVQVQMLNDLAQSLRRIENAEQSAQVLLKGMPANPDASSGDEAALTVLKAQLVAITTSDTNSKLQLVLPSLDAKDGTTNRAQLETLVANLEQTRVQLSNQLTDQRTQYETQAATRADELNSEIRSMRADLELARADRNRLTANRDLAQLAYSELAKKVQAQTIANAGVGREVDVATLAGGADPLLQLGLVPRAIGVVLGVLCAGLIGLALQGLWKRWWESPSLGPASGIGGAS